MGPASYLRRLANTYSKPGEVIDGMTLDMYLNIQPMPTCCGIYHIYGTDHLSYRVISNKKSAHHAVRVLKGTILRRLANICTGHGNHRIEPIHFINSLPNNNYIRQEVFDVLKAVFPQQISMGMGRMAEGLEEYYPLKMLILRPDDYPAVFGISKSKLFQPYWDDSYDDSDQDY